ncbi:MAG: hypothetical protein K0S98_1130 [Propionibacteriaceae bacterium]|nr:hypothetical protein [Propionibacteriaceae bacterium]
MEAVAGVSFGIEAGEIVGFLGPNGAGLVRRRDPVEAYVAKAALVDLAMSLEAVGLESLVPEHIDGIANDQGAVDAAVCGGRPEAADFGESIRIGSY